MSLADRIPHDNRIEDGSVNIPPAVFPQTSIPKDVNAGQVATEAVTALNDALSRGDSAGLAALFAADGAWRDHLGLSWDLRTLTSPAAVAAFFKEEGRSQGLALQVDASEARLTPCVAPLDVTGEAQVVQAFLTFVTAVGSGRGVLRLIPEGTAWKVLTLYTALLELTGFEEPLGPHRPLGASHGGGRHMKNWVEKRAEEQAFRDQDPAVLVIGAGQGGLTSAARLKMLQVSTLVVDRETRVGDNWRQRYRQLVLHDPVWFDHLPYLSFPAFWPVFTPKDKLADFFEAYVALLELNVWVQTEIRSLQYDAAQKRYDVTLERTLADDTTETRVLHPRHIIQATGHSGKKNLPAIPGMETFQGPRWHSSEFPGATPPVDDKSPRRKAVVVGSCNSGHDIAQDLYENGYDVTMVQRSSTCVVSSASIRDIGLGGLYSEAVQARLPVDDADLLNWSLPTALSKAVQVQLTARSIEQDAPLLQGLEQAGFRLDRGTDGGGLFFKYFQRGGGYYIDVGASQLIIDGQIGIQSGQAVREITADGLVLADGTRLPADVLVFATGFQNMRTQTRVLFGDALADRCADVWGFDREGEFRTMWRRSGQPGYWFMGGNLAISRHFGRFLALQIKAQEAGLMAYE